MPVFILVIVEFVVWVVDLVIRKLVQTFVARSPLGQARSLFGSFRVARSVYIAWERHESVKWLIKRLGQHVTVRRRLTYYNSVLRHTTEFRNVWSRGVIGGFVNLNFVGQQPPVRHGTARVSLILHGRKIPMKGRKPRAAPPNIRGGARFRSRLRRSVLGV